MCKKKGKNAANPKTADTEEACKQTGSSAIISLSEVWFVDFGNSCLTCLAKWSPVGDTSALVARKLQSGKVVFLLTMNNLGLNPVESSTYVPPLHFL